jgi:Tfp pilus assembly protein PilW
MRRRSGAPKSDGGFTLIEMIIATALSVVVLGVLASVFVSVSKAQSSVTSLGSATTSGQLAVRSIDRAVRNSSVVARSVVATSDLLVQSRTVGSGTTAVWSCIDWYFSANDKTIRFKTSSSAITAPTSTADQRSWTLLASGVTPVSASTPVFALSTTSTGQTLTVSFRVTTAGAPSVFTNASSNQTVPTGTPTCI